jgi:hypothetical protein
LTKIAGPVNVPDTDFAVGVGSTVLVGVGVAVALWVGLTVGSAVADVVALAFAVAFFVATGFEDLVAVAEAVVATAFVEVVDEADAEVLVEPIPAPPAMFIELLELSCGGVIASTAPRPPTVPPAINNARFISYPRFVNPRQDQHLYKSLSS